jgi:SprT protein
MKQDARVWADEALELLSCSVVLRIEFNTRFTARMGDATYKTPYGPRIRLSEPMWPRISQNQRKDTVIHEVCHIKVRHDDVTTGRRRSKPHGLEWQHAMRTCGLEPQVTHDFDVSQLAGSRRKARAYCGCDKPHMITPQRLNKIIRGAQYRCRRCKEHLTLEPSFRPAPTPPQPKTMADRLAEQLSDIFRIHE